MKKKEKKKKVTGMENKGETAIYLFERDTEKIN